MDNYYHKYIKYKTKYIWLQKELNRIQKGGSLLIIHICGSSGAGKSTIGDKLKQHFGQKIIVKDLDDLRGEYVDKKYGGYQNIWNTANFAWDINNYQKWIDDFVNNQSKPLIFVGLNHMPWWHKDHYYNVHSQHNFYIQLDSDIVFKQKCSRFINDVFVQNQNQTLNDIIENEFEAMNDLTEGLKNECNYKQITEMNIKWDTDYKNQNYTFMPRELIYDTVCDIINKRFNKSNS